MFNPPYQLALCDRLPKKNSKEFLYLFKVYGSHDFVKLSHADILASNQIMSAINPRDLIKIALLENNLQAQRKRCKVEAELRGNQYRIHIHGNSETCSGESICQNIDYFSDLSAQDICKIAYTTGFLKGRNFSRQFSAAAVEARRRNTAAPDAASKVLELRAVKR
ncbi:MULTISPECIES: hypothetical protein [Chromobacterium]|uniref:Uncharacterized protein n=1 Tax=Chromobacterium aquaticum TaxID=467180 RepID=A0ABV8ZSI7_9NEIS|nr:MULTISPECIES: hypothetical protein [Chromobacterium]MCD5364461.1 hypothetical protein [Chromobacterium aquaticum]